MHVAMTHVGYVAAGWGDRRSAVLGRLRAAHRPPRAARWPSGCRRRSAGGADAPHRRPTARSAAPHAAALGLRRAASSCSSALGVVVVPGPRRRHAVLLQRRRGGRAAGRPRRQALPAPGHGRSATTIERRPTTASTSRSPSTASTRRRAPRGDPPELFKAGIPVVLEGRWAADGDVVRQRPHPREALRGVRGGQRGPPRRRRGRRERRRDRRAP